MKQASAIIAVLLELLVFAIGATTEAQREIPDAVIAETQEYKAAKAAQEKADGDTMYAKAKILIEQYPRSPLAYETMCSAYSLLGLPKEAAEAAQMRVELSPEDPSAWTQLGRCQQKAGNNAAANVAYKKAADLSPEDQSAPPNFDELDEVGKRVVKWIELAQKVSSRGDHASAITFIDEGLKLIEEARKRPDQKANFQEMRGLLVIAKTVFETRRQQQRTVDRTQDDVDLFRKPERSSDGIIVRTHEVIRDHVIQLGSGAMLRIKRGESYRTRILVDRAEIDVNGIWFSVPRSVLNARPRD
ncbi:MAG: hypothetical protein ABMA01_14500 [Chthoniobacteraceae bacterium]